MPLRKDLKSVLLIGSGSDRDRPGLRVRLLRHAGAQGAARGRAAAHPGQLESGHDHDRPGTGRSDLYRADDGGSARAKSSSANGPTRCCRRWAARRRSTWRSSLPKDRSARTLRRRADRRQARRDQEGRGSRPLQARDDRYRPGSAGFRGRALARAGRRNPRAPRLAADHSALAHAGRHRRFDRARPRGVPRQGRSGASRCRPITRC